MKKKTFLLIMAGLVLLPAMSMGDTVSLNSGDILKGVVAQESFFLVAPYGALRIERDHLKEIRKAPGANGFSFLTLNNDLFTGRPEQEELSIALDAGSQQTLEMEDVARIVFDYQGETEIYKTMLFTMENSDRFSGRLLDDAIAIASDFNTLSFAPADISRLEFSGGRDRLLLNNGTKIDGTVLLDRLHVLPDAASEMTICRKNIVGIYLNTEKLVFPKVINAEKTPYDTDGDGVADARDRCPETQCLAKVDESGCAVEGETAGNAKGDSDGDGISDEADQCPRTPEGVQVNENGCWRASAVHFEFNRYDVAPADLPALDEVSQILEAHLHLQIAIFGHTDNIGTREYNNALSLKRAEAVKNYLAGQGIDLDRLTTDGFADQRPAASNDSESGRAQNRRVEIVQFPDKVM